MGYPSGSAENPLRRDGRSRENGTRWKIHRGTMEDASALCASSPITAKEQLQRTADGKNPDSRGVVMELLKHSGDDFLAMVAQVFTDILNPLAKVRSTGRRRDLKCFSKRATHSCQTTTDQSLSYQSCRSYSAKSCVLESRTR